MRNSEPKASRAAVEDRPAWQYNAMSGVMAGTSEGRQDGASAARESTVAPHHGLQRNFRRMECDAQELQVDFAQGVRSIWLWNYKMEMELRPLPVELV
jgi:hypothetical protein